MNLWFKNEIHAIFLTEAWAMSTKCKGDGITVHIIHGFSPLRWGSETLRQVE